MRTTNASWRASIIAALLVGTIGFARAAAPPQRPAEDTVLDEDVKLASFVDMDYPLLARRGKIQGVVVVRVALDDGGHVAGASAISGAKVLIPDVLANVKKWTFRPNDRKTAIVVYEFRIDGGACHDALKSLFLLRHYNFATITACSGVIEG